MSKFFVTNDAELHNRLTTRIEKSKFKLAFNKECNGIYAISTHKLLIDNTNYFDDANDFIVQTGTGVYEEKIGADNLRKALNEFDGNVDCFRNHWLGNFGVAVKKAEKCYFFSEAVGFYDVFYFCKDGKWLIGTSLIDMADVLKNEISLNKLNVLERLVRFTVLDNQTIFNGISRLAGNQYIVAHNNTITVNNLDWRINQTAPEDSASHAKAIANDMKRIANVMCRNFGTAMLGCTGGYDSRMSLAAFLAADAKPLIAYGMGNSLLAPSAKKDVEINELFSKRYDLKFRLGKWNESTPIDKRWNEFIESYGDLIYDGCEDAFDFYTRADEPFITFGYLGELYREDQWSKDIPEGKMTLEDYMKNFYANTPNINILKQRKDLQQHCIDKWKNINKENGIDTDFFNKNDIFWISLAYRCSADSHMVNKMNMFKYSYYLMSEIDLVRNSYVNLDQKFNGRFMLQIMDNLYPDILEVPFFSHYRTMIFNRDKMVNEETFSAKMRNLIMPHLKSGILFKMLEGCKKLVGKEPHRNTFFDAVEDLLKKEDNEKKLRQILGDSTFDMLDIKHNYILIIRAIILAKKLESIGFAY